MLTRKKPIDNRFLFEESEHILEPQDHTMLSILNNPTYRRLFSAQILSLLGTGLATVALGLMAFDLAGQDAGVVLATILTIKMLAYVLMSPLLSAALRALPRRTSLVALDMIRAITALSLPFAQETWHIYGIIFVLQSCSAGFTPLFQATIPDVLPDSRDYTKALSLSRLAYDLENLISPGIAALLLLFTSWHVLFLGTMLGFIASAALILSADLPKTEPQPHESWQQRLTSGIRHYLCTPCLRGVLLMTLAAAMGCAMMFVNTSVIVQGYFQQSSSHTALALAAFGCGSMLLALYLPRLSDRLNDRYLMLSGLMIIAVAQAMGMMIRDYIDLLVVWFISGAGYALVNTPIGKVLAYSSRPHERSAIFAAHFSLSHAGWMLAYPTAGWAFKHLGLEQSFILLLVITLVCLYWVRAVWSESKTLSDVDQSMLP